MTYSDYLATFEDIMESFQAGELTETQLEHELEMLQEEYENDCEEY